MAEDEGSVQELAEPVAEEKQPEAFDEATPEEEAKLHPPLYEVRPGLGDKFQSQAIQEIILTSMQQQLMGRQYRADQAPQWVQNIVNGVRHRVQELNMKRYKIIVQSYLIEMKGAGVKSAQRTLWDPECDDFVHELFRSDTVFCHTTVYGVYMY